MPWASPPCTWPSTIMGLTTLPKSSLAAKRSTRSEEHTSELQSQSNLVCRLLLEKKKKTKKSDPDPERRAIRKPLIVPAAHTLCCLTVSCIAVNSYFNRPIYAFGSVSVYLSCHSS